MNAIKQNTIENYNEAIARLEKHRDAVDLLPDALTEIPGAALYHSDFYLRIDIPMTPTAFANARRLLGRDWKRQGYEHQDENGNRYFSLVHKITGVALTLGIRADKAGATCQRRQVGEKTVPVYEVICN